jgi:surface antigen
MALPPSLDGGRCHFDKLTGKKLGLIVGATIGAAIGAGAARDEDRAFATALGAVIGALVGKTIGEALSENSRRCITEALEHAPDRQTITWHDSDAKLDYALTPTRSFTGDAGKPCRDYVIDASDSATSKHADGSACRYGDNAWQILK